MTVRSAERSDALAIARVQVASWHVAYQGLMPEPFLAAFTVEAREAAWERILAATSSHPRTTVFEREGNIVAFASFGPSRDEAGFGEVWALYAAPEAWGTGAGRALLADGLTFLAVEGHQRVMLWVLEGNARAIRFYLAAGFRLDGRVEKDGLPHLRMIRD